MTSDTGVNELYCLALRILHDVHTMTISPIDTFSEYFPIKTCRTIFFREMFSVILNVSFRDKNGLLLKLSVVSLVYFASD